MHTEASEELGVESNDQHPVLRTSHLSSCRKGVFTDCARDGGGERPEYSSALIPQPHLSSLFFLASAGNVSMVSL